MTTIIADAFYAFNRRSFAYSAGITYYCSGYQRFICKRFHYKLYSAFNE